jgi:hypothetical protein
LFWYPFILKILQKCKEPAKVKLFKTKKEVIRLKINIRKSFLLSSSLAEPLEPFMEPITGQGAGTLDVPFSSSQLVETQLLGDFRNTHHAHILLVGQDQEHGVLELIFWEHLLKLLSGNLNSFLIWGVDDVDERLGVLVVMLPELSDLILSSDVPHCELDFLEFNSLNVKSDGWNWWDNLAQLELVENGCFTGGIETEHQGSELFLSEKITEDFSEVKTHLIDF